MFCLECFYNCVENCIYGLCTFVKDFNNEIKDNLLKLVTKIFFMMLVNLYSSPRIAVAKNKILYLGR